MGTRHDRDEILDAAIDVAHADGLHQLTFGRVAKQLGIADRTVVYYFPTKHDLASAVVIEIGVRLQTLLETTLTEPAIDHRHLVGRLWPTLERPEHADTMRVYLEALGLAAARTPPYDTLVPQLINAWADWATKHIDHERAADEASAALAIIDGLLVLHQVGYPQRAHIAIQRLLLDTEAD